MRCAYLILAHRWHRQLARLVAALTQPDEARQTNDTAYIHLDKRIDPAPFAAALRDTCGDQSWALIGERVTTAWGDFSLVQAALNLIRAAMTDAAAYDSVSLLSGQDYPLVGVAEMKRRLESDPGAEHLSYFPLPYSGWAMDGGLDRVRKYHNPGLRERVRASGVPGARYAGAAAALLLSRVPRSEAVPGGLTIYGGWQWWTLTAASAEYVLRYAEHHPNVVKFFRYSFIPDELFFQTILMNSPFAAQVTGDYRRMIVWDDLKPRVFTQADLPMLIEASASSLFARKFEAETREGAALLDELDCWRRGGSMTGSPPRTVSGEAL